MAWYWIVAIAIGYFIIGGIIAAAVEGYDRDITDGMVAITLCWPIFAALAIVVGAFYSFVYLGKLIVRGFVSLIDWLFERIKNAKQKKAIKALYSKSNKGKEQSYGIDDISYDRRSK